MRDPDSLDDISKERFEGTILRAISKNIKKKIKKEPREEGRGADGQTLLGQVQKIPGKSFESLRCLKISVN